MNNPLNPSNSIIFELAKSWVHRIGPALIGFSVKYDYTWGKVYR